LSGGVDSSLITALSAKKSKKKFSSFHMRWDNVKGKIDESKFANKVVEDYGLNNFTKNITEIDIPNLLAKLIWHLDEPFGDAAFVPTYILAEHAAKNVKVILSGAGGDELFGGYTRYKNYSKIKSIIGKVFYNKSPSFSFYDINKGAYTRHWKNAFKWYKPGSAKDQFDSLWRENKKEDNLNAYMLGDLKFYLQDNILALTDKMSSAASIECRVPLLDHRLVELSLKVPSKLKIKGQEYKYILKKYSEKYLDKKILYREKEGFGSPVWSWIDKYRFSHFNSLLREGSILQEMKINERFLTNMMNKKNLNYGEYWMYWHLLVLEIWTRIYVKNIPYQLIFK
jgi:asparagine synthase (glutamine-hydrolysing)